MNTWISYQQHLVFNGLTSFQGLVHIASDQKLETGKAWGWTFSLLSLPQLVFNLLFNLGCLDFAMQCLLMYMMAHTFKDYQFLPRVVPISLQLHLGSDSC